MNFLQHIAQSFAKFKKRHSPNEYLRVKTGFEIDDKFKALMKKNRDLLLLNQIPINKVRFTAVPSFTYDIDDDVVNPRHEFFAPLRKDGSGLFDNTAPIIEFSKPGKVMMVNVRSLRVVDNYAFIMNMAKNSKRGVVIFLVDEVVSDFKGNDMYYRSSVDSDELRIVDLDVAVASLPEIIEA